VQVLSGHQPDAVRCSVGGHLDTDVVPFPSKSVALDA
jgi:hypothetical protein